MVTISYKGSGNAAVDASLLGFGQGLQVGDTKIAFDKGFVQLSDSQGRQVNMGFFSSLQALSSKESTIRSFVFRAKTVCTVIIGKAAYDYNNLNEWVTYNYISEQEIHVTRTATGQNPDVFDWQFFASDDPKFAFTIQRASRESETEVLFITSQRAINTYTKNVNLHGSKKIILILTTENLGETGRVTINSEIFDTAKQSWVQLIPSTDLFGNSVVANKIMLAQVGDNIPMKPNSDNAYFAVNNGGISSIGTINSIPIASTSFANASTALAALRYILPSGDNILRFKAVVDTNVLTFSLSIVKVFD